MMDCILDGLNTAQNAAVTSPSAVLQILAPPGSGKTKTLTSRVAYLLAHHGYKPWNILCLTFTIKSAREMKQRIAKLVGNGLESRLILGTFHSICRRYLVSYGHLIGLGKGFGIADAADSKSIIKRIVERLHLNIDYKKAQSRISSSKSRGIGLFDVRQQGLKSRNVDQQEFAIVFDAYEAQLEASNLLDYDDLLLKCVDLLRQHPQCVTNVEVVLIDEFQDTNIVQFDLMRLFAASHKRITTVGDPDQSIYGWRSAEIKNLERMQTQYPDTLVIHLEDNYRSSAAILLAASEVIEQDAARPSRPILPTHCPGSVPVLRKLPTAEIEAKWIGMEIARCVGMTGHLLKHADFAILLRSAQLSRHIEFAMGKAGIPYRMVGGKKFFERAEIKILLDYLQVLSQPNNNDALSRIINVPTRHIGVMTVKALLEEAEGRQSSLWDLVRQTVQGRRPRSRISKPAEHAMSLFVNIILTSRNRIVDLKTPHFPGDVLKFIIKKVEYRRFLERTYEKDHETRWENVEELLAQASEYNPSSTEHATGVEADDALPQIEGVEQGKRNIGEEALSKFLANIALATELQRDGTSANGETMQQSQVTISTIHAAKGLEWPVVFIPSAYEGSIPHSRAEDTDEERRLLYVAMTRAQALLYISFPLRNSQREETTISSFLFSEKVAYHFVSQGPELAPGTVQDIAQILRRDCPSEFDLLDGSRMVENHSDALWPLNGEQDPQIVETRWDLANENAIPSYKRRKVESKELREQLPDRYGDKISARSSKVSFPSTTTMQNSSSFSCQRGYGFTSAATKLPDVLDTQIRHPFMKRTAPRSVFGSENQYGELQAKITESPKTSEAKGNLLSFWAAKDNTDRLPNMSIASPEVLSALVGKAENQEASGQFDRRAKITIATAASGNFKAQKPKLPLAIIPPGLAGHKLRFVGKTGRSCLTGTECDPATRQYAFLSSSPPPYQDLHPEDKESCEQVSAIHHGSDEKIRNMVIEGVSAYRPTTTLHSTSLAELRATSDLPRKTLGVRRSMAGWSSRKSGFSVPSRVTNMR